MQADIARLTAELEAYDWQQPDALATYKRLYTGRNGAVPALFEQLKALPGPEKAQVGKPLNKLKKLAEAKLAEAEAQQAATAAVPGAPRDLSLPGVTDFAGGRHPLRQIEREVVEIFQQIGFQVAEGPEIEDDWHNFTALNFPPGHPARDMQDTFFVRKAKGETDQDVLLRTHTSTVQVRVMESRKPPIRHLMPGRVYRNEAVSARAHCFFHQIEGLVIDEGISVADMKQSLAYFVANFFGPDVPIRLRASYFPFTEISAEMDIRCQICGGSGCNICKHTGWVEIMGCGMVDPAVLENCGIDSSRYSGYAWGMGVERMAQLRYRVSDLRLYSQNDVRFLRQFARVV